MINRNQKPTGIQSPSQHERAPHETIIDVSYTTSPDAIARDRMEWGGSACARGKAALSMRGGKPVSMTSVFPTGRGGAPPMEKTYEYLKQRKPKKADGSRCKPRKQNEYRNTYLTQTTRHCEAPRGAATCNADGMAANARGTSEGGPGNPVIPLIGYTTPAKTALSPAIDCVRRFAAHKVGNPL